MVKKLVKILGLCLHILLAAKHLTVKHMLPIRLNGQLKVLFHFMHSTCYLFNLKPRLTNFNLYLILVLKSFIFHYLLLSIITPLYLLKLIATCKKNAQLKFNAVSPA